MYIAVPYRLGVPIDKFANYLPMSTEAYAYIEYKDARLAYRRLGNGAAVLLAFHGFGQEGSVYEKLNHLLADQYTTYSFDLFFHGHSTWPLEKGVLEKEFWAEIMQVFFEKENISRFSVIGFSMGARFALVTLEAFPQQVESLFLVAPDGIRVSFWYLFATCPGFPQRLFRNLIFNPARFTRLANTFQKMGLADAGIVRFSQSQLTDTPKRSRVYHSWVTFRKVIPDKALVASLINQYQINTRFYIGHFDRLTTQKDMRALVKRLHHHELIVLESGHTQLLNKVVSHLRKQKEDQLAK